MNSMLAPELQPSSPSLSPGLEPGNLSDRVKETHEFVAHRAYQLFEARGHQHGHDLEDWLCAEAEILIPIEVKTYEFEDTFITHAQVPFLTADDIQVSVEQRRIIISNKDQPDILAKPLKRVLCTVLLPDRVDWTSAAMSFKDGVLEVEVPRLSNSGHLYGMG